MTLPCGHTAAEHRAQYAEGHRAARAQFVSVVEHSLADAPHEWLRPLQLLADIRALDRLTAEDRVQFIKRVADLTTMEVGSLAISGAIVIGYLGFTPGEYIRTVAREHDPIGAVAITATQLALAGQEAAQKFSADILETLGPRNRADLLAESERLLRQVGIDWPILDRLVRIAEAAIPGGPGTQPPDGAPAPSHTEGGSTVDSNETAAEATPAETPPEPEAPEATGPVQPIEPLPPRPEDVAVTFTDDGPAAPPPEGYEIVDQPTVRPEDLAVTHTEEGPVTEETPAADEAASDPLDGQDDADRGDVRDDEGD